MVCKQCGAPAAIGLRKQLTESKVTIAQLRLELAKRKEVVQQATTLVGAANRNTTVEALEAAAALRVAFAALATAVEAANASEGRW